MKPSGALALWLPSGAASATLAFLPTPGDTHRKVLSGPSRVPARNANGIPTTAVVD